MTKILLVAVLLLISSHFALLKSADLLNKRYDETVFLTTHNSFCSSEYDFSQPNQTYSITKQLNDGVRALMLDVYSKNDKTLLYHGYPVFGSISLLKVMLEVRKFLNDNPSEIITLIFESYIDCKGIDSVLNKSGLSKYIYKHNSKESWPKIREMVESNQRLVIFNDKRCESSDYAGLNYLWDNCVETHYDVKNPNNFTNEYNRGNESNALIILNHFITTKIGFGNRKAAQVINSETFLKNRISNFISEQKRIPNFVTVDFYNLGDCISIISQLNSDGF
jgi:hypothetical protein